MSKFQLTNKAAFAVVAFAFLSVISQDAIAIGMRFGDTLTGNERTCPLINLRPAMPCQVSVERMQRHEEGYWYSRHGSLRRGRNVCNGPEER